MPEFVRAALDERGLREQYDARPAYQRNDYLLWINKAKQDETKQKRLSQMLEELEEGFVYMRMDWRR
ncbi:YdeI/OmpD-associated family protein [Devosia sp.]|uniref:YdeI/OmpD-associated family protein n=1 Tax=Devosia sp. TaxID=1871048 RepID=UPI001AC5731D|nr:YdeI/OmpD-associated family protein [Devosia sp.]MBN9334081.1 YdeI/OmpD-associated family protein [Devosia sp.]